MTLRQLDAQEFDLADDVWFGCCAIEMMSMGASRFDIARLGRKCSGHRRGRAI